MGRTRLLPLVLLALLLTSGPARALEIRGVRVGEDRGYVITTLQLEHALSQRIQGTLERGMPATVLISVDVWRDRPGWFDQLVGTRGTMFQARLDVWSDEYRLSQNDGAAQRIADLPALVRAFERPMRVAVTRVANLRPDQRYYVVINVTVKPLTVDDLKGVEKWLSGEAARTGRKGPGSLAQLPVELVRVLANLSGLGDEGATHRSRDFQLEGLLRGVDD
jgi:hypothetical protein